MKFLLIILVSINLFADIKMPSELYGRYFQTEYGPESCILLKEDQDPLEIFQGGMSFGTWYVCNPNKIVKLPNNNFMISFFCSDAEGQDNVVRVTAKINKQSIYMYGKLFAKRCKQK